MSELKKEEYYELATDAIRKAIGPAPWYWETFPEIKTDSGSRYLWSIQEKQGSNTHNVSLRKFNQTDEMKILLNTHTRPFLIGKHYLGIWFSRNDKITLRCFDLDKMPSFKSDDIPDNFYKLFEPYYCIGKYISEITIDSRSREGIHNLHVPEEFKMMDEILLVGSYHAESAAYAIYLINPKEEKFEVKPQKWFSRNEFDIGYQWIARITRHPQSKKIIGDGVRICAFELKDNGCDLDRWF